MSAFLCCLSTENSNGFLSASLASSLRSWFRVAETIRVWRFGFLEAFTTCMSSSLNPISRSLSASSRTRISMSSSEKPLVFFMWSMSLPGVATIRSGLSKEICLFWSLRLLPPKMAVVLKFPGMYLLKF